ncbi:Tethering factor for nuclear proteasome STS [Salix suchowensis]|nr:Tethering factor for nuclear proteasome STS [Salix suchowensis]
MNPTAFSPHFSNIHQSSPSKAQKRRHDSEENDETMDRSPTPERPKRIIKRLKPTVAQEPAPQEKESKENKAPVQDDDNDVDVGLLLGEYAGVNPSLKSLILPLIPRPTMETAIQALAASAKKLRDAYPYHNPSTFTPSQQPAAALGFGFGLSASNRTGMIRAYQSQPSIADASDTVPSTNLGGMRESYVLSRLAPHINDFVAVAVAYLPYFSYIARVGPATSTSQSHSIALQALQKDKTHPSESFAFLSSLTTHVLSQPELTLTALLPQILPRIAQEWKAWVERVDEIVNRQRGMFGRDTVLQWERTLDEYATAKGPEEVQIFRDIRDQWIVKVGWLVGRRLPQQMVEVTNRVRHHHAIQYCLLYSPHDPHDGAKYVLRSSCNRPSVWRCGDLRLLGRNVDREESWSAQSSLRSGAGSLRVDLRFRLSQHTMEVLEAQDVGSEGKCNPSNFSLNTLNENPRLLGPPGGDKREPTCWSEAAIRRQINVGEGTHSCSIKSWP